MDWMQTVILALVQGLTEFLPVSSSAHLILFPKMFGWPDQGLAFDVAVHLGTLIAVCHYFREDIVRLLAAWSNNVTKGHSSSDSRLAWGIILATVPIVIAGLFFGDWVEHTLRSPVVLGIASIVFGILLWLADRFCSHEKAFDQLNLGHAGWIGLGNSLFRLH